MVDKDDMFAADDDVSDMLEDDFFGDFSGEEEEQEEEPVVAPKKIKKPESMQKAVQEATPEPEEVEEVEEDDEDPLAEPEEVEEVEAEAEAEAEVEDDVEEEEESEEEVEEEVEVEVVAEAEEPKKAAPKKAAPKQAAPRVSSSKGKRVVKPLTDKQKAVNNILRKAGLEDELPTLDHLMRCKQGTKVKVSDIAVFIDEPEDEILKDLYKNMNVLNRVNLSAEVDLNRVKVVGGQVLGAGRMYQPIQVAKIEEDGRLECTSGRHRLVFLALVYGTDIEIPVYVEDMNINEARDAVVVANMARKAKAMEQAEHAVLAAVGGDVDADLDDIYTKTVTTKANAKKYCAYMVLERSRPAKLGFKLGGRKEGGIATIGTIEGYWGNALDWHREMPRKDFDAALKNSTEFLNNLVVEFEKNASFDAAQHMASMTLKAVGKYYKTMSDAGVEIDAASLVNVVVAMGDIGRQKSEETYAAIVKAMK